MCVAKLNFSFSAQKSLDFSTDSLGEQMVECDIRFWVEVCPGAMIFDNLSSQQSVLSSQPRPQTPETHANLG